MTDAAGAGPLPGFWRRLAPVWALGVLGILALALQPLPAPLLAPDAPTAGLTPVVLRVLVLVQPLLLVTVAAAVGAGCAHRVGLRSRLAGTAARAGFGAVLARAAALGLLLGLALAAADRWWLTDLGEAAARLQAATLPLPRALAIGLLYGGLAEEVMLRWGLMSLLAWLLLRLHRPTGSPREAVLTPAMAAVAIGSSALAFAAAHLPALASMVPLTPDLAARTMVLNGLAGVLYGVLFWRQGLEAAMAAHAATHVGLAAWRAVPA